MFKNYISDTLRPLLSVETTIRYRTSFRIIAGGLNTNVTTGRSFQASSDWNNQCQYHSQQFICGKSKACKPKFALRRPFFHGLFH